MACSLGQKKKKRQNIPTTKAHLIQIETGEALVLTLVNSLVVITGLIRNPMVVSILPHTRMISSITGTRVSTVNYMLD